MSKYGNRNLQNIPFFMQTVVGEGILEQLCAIIHYNSISIELREYEIGHVLVIELKRRFSYNVPR